MPGWIRCTPARGKQRHLLARQVGLDLVEQVRRSSRPRPAPGRRSLKYFMSRMLSTTSTKPVCHRADQRRELVERARGRSCCETPCAAPLRPQNVQCDFAPHQQPREVSNSKVGATSAAAPLASSAREIVADNRGPAARPGRGDRLRRAGGDASPPPRRGRPGPVWRPPPRATRRRPARPTSAGKRLVGLARADEVDESEPRGAVRAPISPSQFAPPNTMTRPGAARLEPLRQRQRGDVLLEGRGEADDVVVVPSRSRPCSGRGTARSRRAPVRAGRVSAAGSRHVPRACSSR